MTGFHSVIDRPESVSRVIPPTTTIRNINAQQPNSHAATARRRSSARAVCDCAMAIAEIDKLGTAIEAVLPSVSGTRNVFAERTGGGFFLDIEWNREALARYGLSIETAQSVVQNAIGGENVTTTVEGRERYPVNVRYMRDFRSDTDALAHVLVPASDGQRQIPLGELARVKIATGPAMIRDEDGLLTGYVFVDVAGRDISSYVDEASRVVREQVKLAPGYAVLWSGQYEAMARVRARLTYIVPWLDRFMKQYPHISPDWHFDNRPVDLIGENFDAAIGGGFDIPPGVVARELGREAGHLRVQ